MEKKVLLFSGGFDSMLQEYLIKPDVLLYVDMGTSYSERELEALMRLPLSYRNRLIIKRIDLGEYERENKYLPYRNLILGTIAMQYGQHVYFGFNHTDDAPDKDDMFLNKTTSLFRHLNKNCIGDMHWENTNFSFNAPFKKYSKTEMVKMCLDKGMSVKLIQNIRSCYDSYSDKGCGVCYPCLNKAIALINNGIFEKGLFDEEITVEQLSERLKSIIDNPQSYPKKYLYDVRKARTLLRQM